MENDEESPSNIDLQTWFPKRQTRAAVKPGEHTKRILQAYFEARPTVESDRQAIDIVLHQTGFRYDSIVKVLKTEFVKEEAKRQRREYADEIYKEKTPLVKSIVALALDKLNAFVETFNPLTIDDAKGLSKIATDMNTLLRLELGQSTSNAEIVIKTEKSVQTILGELAEADPFVDYVEIADDAGK